MISKQHDFLCLLWHALVLWPLKPDADSPVLEQVCSNHLLMAQHIAMGTQGTEATKRTQVLNCAHHSFTGRQFNFVCKIFVKKKILLVFPWRLASWILWEWHVLIVVLLHPVLSLTVFLVLFGLLEGAGRFYCAFICFFFAFQPNFQI